jgi:hypothetical protein
MMPSIRLPASLIIVTSVNEPSDAVTDTGASGSTSWLSLPGATVTTAGAGAGGSGRPATVVTQSPGHRSNIALDTVIDVEAQTNTVAVTIARV